MVCALKWIGLVALLLPLLAMPAWADSLSISFADPIGDQTGNIDVVQMDFVLDNATGAYTVTLTASDANPFSGDFRVNLALFNPDTGQTTVDPAFLQDDLNDFSLDNPSQTVTFTGSSPKLMQWQTGHRVATSNGPFGLPSDASFFSFNTLLVEAPFPSGIDQIALNGSTTIVMSDPPAGPAISSVNPVSMQAGGPSFLLTVVGENFTTSSRVQWNGEDRFAVFNSTFQLRARIPASDIATPGSAEISILNPEGISSPIQTFTIGTPVPFLCCTDPTSSASGSSDLDITVFGNGFVPGSTVLWNGAARSTSFISGQRLEASIPFTDLTSAATAQLSVRNPDSSASGNLNFPVRDIPPDAPRITSINPDAFPAGGGAFTLTVNGTGFVANSQVQFNDQDRVTTFASSMRLTAEILAQDVATASTFSVTVTNPDAVAPSEPPLAVTGNEAVVVVTNPAPVLLKIAPTITRLGGTGVALVLEGLQFVSSSRVRWNGQERDTTFISASRLEAAIENSDLLQLGTATVTVATPGPGGGVTGSFTFTIQPTDEISTSLLYPRFVSTTGVDNALDDTETTGIAVANLSGSDATLTFTAYESPGTLVGGPDIVNPASIPIRSTEQIPITDSQIFGVGLSQRSTVGWIKLESTVKNIVGFFLSFNDSLSILDGADVSSEALTSFVLPEIESEGFTEVHVSNPSDSAAEGSFELYDASGSVRSTASRTVNPNGSLATLVADSPTSLSTPKMISDVLFPGIEAEASYYVRATSDTAVVPFEYLGKAGNFVEGVNGQDATAGSTVLYSPQYVVGGGVFRTTLSVVNLEGVGGTVTFKFIGDDGVQIGAAQSRAIRPLGKIYIDAQDFFLSDLDSRTQGYVEITSDGPKLVGSVVFGDPGRSQFSSALPLIATLRTALVFGQIASNSTYFTGVAIINPNAMDVEATIEVLDRNGNVLRRKTETIPAGQRTSLLLTQFFPDLVDEDISSGYIKVTVDKGVASFSLFGTNSLSVLSSVPPQIAPLSAGDPVAPRP